MSILLRKQCQELLDEAGLPELHVGIHNKCLALDGECGQTIVSISGIQFSANTPKVKELGYAVELFTVFLQKHKAKLVTYIAKRKANKDAEKPGKPSWAYSTNYNISYVEKGNLGFTPEGKIYVSNNGLTLEEVNSLHAEYIDRVTEHFNALNHYAKTQEELNVLKAEIVTCNI